MPSIRAKRFDLKVFTESANWLAIAVVASLPWSTSASAALIVLWLLAVLPTLGVSAVRRELATMAGGLPALLWLLAALGMLWADVPWSERLDGLGGFYRLLVIPLLLAQFRRGEFGPRACYSFLASATILLALSWVFELIPPSTVVRIPVLGRHFQQNHVPVKDYIFQSGIFLICAFALIGTVFELRRKLELWKAATLLGLAACFITNIVFVISGRTTVLTAPFLAALLGYRLFGRRGVLVAGVVTTLLVGAAILVSPYLYGRAMDTLGEAHNYLYTNAANSTGLHMEYLKKSAEIFIAAPVIGHGTGSISEQFRMFAYGASGTASAAVTTNPHSQIFAVAIELGALGVTVLLAMWLAHFALFREGSVMALIGAIIVVSNVASSLVNSHLFDFSQGWLYVFGVGITGGTLLRDSGPRQQHRSAR